VVDEIPEDLTGLGVGVAPHRTPDEPGRTLRDLLTRYGPDAVRLLDG
jgi:hypothetical protein